MRLLYFAWVRERIGCGEEELALPDEVSNVGDLLAWLSLRGEDHAGALADRGRIRIAVNQDYVGDDAPVSDGDEVAIFPPVTGG